MAPRSTEQVRPIHKKGSGTLVRATVAAGLIGGSLAGGYATSKPAEAAGAAVTGRDAVVRIIGDPKRAWVDAINELTNISNKPKRSVEIEAILDNDKLVREELFGRLTPEEEIDLQTNLIDPEIKNMVGDPNDPENPPKITPESFAAIEENTDLIFNLSKISGVSMHTLVGIILTESLGNPNAISPKGARGLTGIMPVTAAQYGVSEDELTDPNRAMPVTVAELNKAHVNYNGVNGENNDRGLEVLAYNAGQGTVFEALSTYFKDQGFVSLEVPQDVDLEDFKGAEESEQIIITDLLDDYQRVIREQKINVFKLLKDENVYAMFNEGKIYVYRVAAFAQIYERLKKINDK